MSGRGRGPTPVSTAGGISELWAQFLAPLGKPPGAQLLDCMVGVFQFERDLGVSLTMAVAFCTPSSSEGGTASSLALGVSGVGFWLHKRCLGVAQCCFHFPPDNV